MSQVAPFMWLKVQIVANDPVAFHVVKLAPSSDLNVIDPQLLPQSSILLRSVTLC